ncbi:MAG: SAM-dependent methyltransferase [Gammaproteobacteria bacterium]|jgi:SAM-dependent methyltransferase
MNEPSLTENNYGRHVSNCRMCDSNSLYQFLDLGHTPPADEFRVEKDILNPIVSYPLQVCVCNNCGLVQLSYIVNPVILYQNDYPYESYVTATGRNHWNEFASTVVKRFKLKNSSLIVDIGSNVGVLLGAFKNNGMEVQGIDPAQGIVDIANKEGVKTRCSFFNDQVVTEIIEEAGTASVVTATNVFAHVDDLKAFVKTLDSLLAEDGVFIFEAPYLFELLENTEYDTIYHEHLSYLSIKPIISFFKKHGFEIFDVEERKIHGGSIRVFVCRNGVHKNTGKPHEYAINEVEKGIYDHEYLDNFAMKVYENKVALRNMLYQLKKEGNRIAAVSAPAKGMTLLNYCGIGSHELEFITEKSKLKKGKYIPGCQLKVLDDSALVEFETDYALLLAWNFSDEIIKNLEEYREQGGKFIIPIPTPKII